MYNSKKDGGMGFRNMMLLNQDMLTKQASRVLNNEVSLMARNLKANIFQNVLFRRR